MNIVHVVVFTLYYNDININLFYHFQLLRFHSAAVSITLTVAVDVVEY